MTRWETWLSHISVSVVTLSGLAYLWMKYVLETDDPFSVVNHPWQPGMLRLHILAAPVVTFVLGLLVNSHVRRKLSGGSRSNRRSGLSALFTFPLMILSGYVLQVSTGPTILRAALVVHLVASGIFVMGYLAHQAISMVIARSLCKPGSAFAALLILVLSLTVLSARSPCVEVSRQVFLMGTQATLISCPTDRESGVEELEAYLEILEDAEAELSTWREDSPISRLNRHPVGSAFLLTARLSQLFETLYSWHRVTAGAFDPGIGALTDVWGIHNGGRLPSDLELQEAMNRSGLTHFAFEPGAKRITRRRDAKVDVGGFGKGEALERVLAYARRHQTAPFLIDLGGQILVHGTPADRDAWQVAIADPLQREREAFSLSLISGSLATSAGSERDLTADGKRIGHIVDPRSGHTVVSNHSVTVWHSNALVADIVSTALYVMGPEDGIAWADRNGVAALFQSPLKTSRAWRQQFPRKNAWNE